MAERKRMKEATCPVARSVDVVGDRWSLLLVRDAFDGIRRFGEFQRSLGVAKNILASRLKALVEEGIFVLEPGLVGTVYQEYALTAKGRALFPVIVALRQWGESELFTEGEAMSRLVDKKNLRPLAALAVRSQDGRAISSSDTTVEKVTSPVA